MMTMDWDYLILFNPITGTMHFLHYSNKGLSGLHVFVHTIGCTCTCKAIWPLCQPIATCMHGAPLISEFGISQ